MITERPPKSFLDEINLHYIHNLELAELHLEEIWRVGEFLQTDILDTLYGILVEGKW